MTTLVTGGTGFVGRYIVDELVDRGTSVISYNRDFSKSPEDRVIAVQGELFDLPKLVRTMKEYEVDKIIHTAAMSHPEISVDLPVTTFAANVEGTLHLLEAARMSGVRRVVNFSSECAYGDQSEDLIVSESAYLLPNTPYGVTKVATELLGRVYNRTYGLDVVSLRVTEVYGPGLKMPEILKDLIVSAVRGKPFSIDEGSEHRFHFIHASDVANAAILASESSSLPSYVYNISGGQQVTIAEAIQLVRHRFPDADIAVGPGHLSGWDRQGPFDISASASDFGYAPQWSLEKGIDAYAAWLNEHDE